MAGIKTSAKQGGQREGVSWELEKGAGLEGIGRSRPEAAGSVSEGMAVLYFALF